MQVITVTQVQFNRIEAAWEICSFGNGRKATGAWARTFSDCVAEALGYTPEGDFALAVAA